ncbi:MAG: tRNA (cytidine(34)-2'-O)-methyltransferase [Phycisphaerales bacterium]|nr:tRNA (cytidine(34)-2'-O)-methyltransferase [Phycisphaerales bacterium]
MPSGTPASPLFHVVLHQPEIPNNTGNIGRTCVATGCSLHLVHPLGFDTSEKACRRAGLDYWPRLEVHHHESFEHFTRGRKDARLWYFTTKARRSVFDAPFARGDYLIFGQETAGLPDSVLQRAGDRAIGFPMLPGERSLNLATVVCSAIYEGVRQLIADGSVQVREDGRLALLNIP